CRPLRSQCRPSVPQGTGPTADRHVRRAEATSCTYRDRHVLVWMPGRIATLDHLLEDLPVPESVHGAPKAFVTLSHELATIDKALEGLHDQLIALLDVVEYLLSEDEVAAVDPYSGILTRAHSPHDSALVEVGQMKGDRRVHGDETSDLTASLEATDH